MYEVCLQLLAIEYHLTDETRRCPECIVKHYMSAELYAGEAMQLDRTRQYTVPLNTLAAGLRRIKTALKADDLQASINETVSLRKWLQPLVWNVTD